MSCCSSGDTTSTQTTSSPIDSQTQGAASQALNLATGIGQQSYIGYDPYQMVAPFTPDQNTAFGMIQDYTTTPQTNVDVYGNAINAAQTYGAAPASTIAAPTMVNPQSIASSQAVNPQSIAAPQTVSSYSSLDPNNPYGTTADYMDPYLSAALQPAINDIQDAGAVQRNDISANATAAGAYGDARHGVTESQQMQDESQQIADMTSQAYSDAYNNAQNQFNTENAAGLSAQQYNSGAATGVNTANVANDLAGQQFNTSSQNAINAQNVGNDLTSQQFNTNAGMTANQFNAGMQEQALQRGLQSGASMLDFTGQNDANNLTNMNALLQSGQIQQQQGQNQADASYQEYLNALNWPMQQLSALESIYNGQQPSQTVKTTEPTNNNDLYAALGALGGSIPL